jgi:hypothetical protein
MSTSSPGFLFTSKKIKLHPDRAVFSIENQTCLFLLRNMATLLPTDRPDEAPTETTPTQDSQPPNTNAAPAPEPAPAQSQQGVANDDDEDSDFDELDGNTYPPLFLTPPPHTPPRGMVRKHSHVQTSSTTSTNPNPLLPQIHPHHPPPNPIPQQELHLQTSTKMPSSSNSNKTWRT